MLSSNFESKFWIRPRISRKLYFKKFAWADFQNFSTIVIFIKFGVVRYATCIRMTHGWVIIWKYSKMMHDSLLMTGMKFWKNLSITILLRLWDFILCKNIHPRRLSSANGNLFTIFLQNFQKFSTPTHLRRRVWIFVYILHFLSTFKQNRPKIDLSTFTNPSIYWISLP